MKILMIDIIIDDIFMISEDFDLIWLIGVLNLWFGFGFVCFGVWLYFVLLVEIIIY